MRVKDISARLITLISSLLVLLVLMVALAILGQPESHCPSEEPPPFPEWSSPYIPLYSRSCPSFYDCPIFIGQGRQSRPDGSEVQVTINEQCFRGEPPSESDEALQILVLGDSFAFGFRVDDNKTFASLLETQLGARLECPVEVINLAVPGYCLEDKLESLNQKGLAYGPDIVVLQIFYDDWFDPQRSQTFIPPITWTARFLAKMNCEKCESWALSLLHLNHYLFQKTHKAYSAKVQRQLGDIWVEFEEVSDDAGFQILVLDLGSEPIVSSIPEDIMSKIEPHFIPYFPEWETPENIIPDDGHPNEHGHEILAAKIEDKLLESGISCG